MKEERFKIIVSTKGVVSETNDAYSIRIPKGSYGGYLFWIPKKFVTTSTCANPDGEIEDVLELSVHKEMTFTLRKYQEKRMITGDVLNEELDRTFQEDYLRGKVNTYVVVPKSSVIEMKTNSYVFKTPRFADILNYKVEIPDKYISINQDGNFSLALPSGEMFTFRPVDGDGASIDLTAYQIYKRMDNTIDSDYDYSKTTMTYEHGDYFYMVLPSIARDYKGPNATLIHMPKGSIYEGKNFSLPNTWVKEHGVCFVAAIPKDFVVTLKDISEVYNPTSENLLHISPEMLVEELKNKSEDDYRIVVRPFEFLERRENVYMLKEDRIPKELKELDRWVAIRATVDEKGKLDKRPIDCNRGCMARIDDPSSFTSFEKATNYAKHMGYKTVAFALTKEDDICCIDVDHSIDSKTGNVSDVLKEISLLAKGTYQETSVSGTGAHIFLKLEDKDVRSFSKNNDIEFYQKSHFIAMTGDSQEEASLKDFKGTELEKYIDENFDKRQEVKNANKRIKGLEKVADVEIIEKAKNMVGGDKFKDLYAGKDIYNDHSRSDMALMNKLAYACNKDKEKMLKIFATSGLYRPEKSREYYEHTAVKACKFVTKYEMEAKNRVKEENQNEKYKDIGMEK